MGEIYKFNNKVSQYVCKIFLALFFFTLLSCDKEIERLDNYLVEFATVIKDGNNYTFKLDNETLLTPDGGIKFNGDTGDRVIVNWIPSNNNIVRINRVTSIYTSSIQDEGYSNLYIKEPVKIQSVWLSGDYLNMIVEIEYHSEPHSIAIVRDIDSETIDLYFAHSTNDDPRGYPRVMYASFLISSLRNLYNTNETPFNLFINTHNGIRQFQFNYKYNTTN